MKKCFVFIVSVVLCFGFAACADRGRISFEPEQSNLQEQNTMQQNSEISQQQTTGSQTETPAASDVETSTAAEQKAVLIVGEQKMEITLYNTPAANALYERLPLTLTFEDFNGIEKIAYLDDALPTEEEEDAYTPSAGDFCLYAPWGNLSIFYQDFRQSSGLISLGYIDSGMDVIRMQSDSFVATLERAD